MPPRIRSVVLDIGKVDARIKEPPETTGRQLVIASFLYALMSAISLSFILFMSSLFSVYVSTCALVFLSDSCPYCYLPVCHLTHPL
jgi:hypothetical protein